MTAVSENRPGQGASTYEDFNNQEFYQETNRLTSLYIPRSKIFIDNAMGTGAATLQLLSQGKLFPDSTVLGFDYSPKQIEASRAKFAEDPRITCEVAPAESLPVSDEIADVMTFYNAAHLTDLTKSFPEAHRVIKKGGLLVVNTAYADDIAYPENSRRTWGLWVAIARDIAQKKFGITDLQDPINPTKYKSTDMVQIAEDSGFEILGTGVLPRRMNQQDLEAIGGYEEFTEGALPGVPYDVAKSSIQQAVPILLEKRNTDSLPRGWFVMYLRKATGEEDDRRVIRVARTGAASQRQVQRLDKAVTLEEAVASGDLY